jgi:hypothetical protein
VSPLAAKGSAAGALSQAQPPQDEPVRAVVFEMSIRRLKTLEQG